MGLANLFLMEKYSVVWKKLASFNLYSQHSLRVLDNSASLSSLVYLLSTMSEKCVFVH